MVQLNISSKRNRNTTFTKYIVAGCLLSVIAFFVIGFVDWRRNPVGHADPSLAIENRKKSNTATIAHRVVKHPLHHYNLVHVRTISNNQSHRFGYSAHVDKNFAVIGAPRANAVVDKSKNRMYKGAVMIYEYHSHLKKWLFREKISSPKANELGCKVAVDASTKTIAVATCQGDAVFVYKTGRGSKFGSVVQKITPRNLIDASHHGSFFGTSVALLGKYLAVGARRQSKKGANYQAFVYIYRRDSENSVFSLEQELISMNGPGRFEVDVAMSPSRRNVLVVGAMAAFGRARIYKLEGRKFVLQSTLTNRLPMFGSSVSLYGNHVAVAAPSTNKSGCVFLFKEQSPNNWMAAAKVTRIWGRRISLDLSESHLLIGSSDDGVFVIRRGRDSSLRMERLLNSTIEKQFGVGNVVASSGKAVIAGGYRTTGEGMVEFYEF